MIRCRRPNPVFSDEYAVIRAIIIDARLEAKMTQRQLATRLGKACSHVARIEGGQRRLDSLELYWMARAFGIDPQVLFVRFAERLHEAINATGAVAACESPRHRAS